MEKASCLFFLAATQLYAFLLFIYLFHYKYEHIYISLVGLSLFIFAMFGT